VESGGYSTGAFGVLFKEFINFLHIAQGSLSEFDTQLELSRRLEFIDEDTWKWLDDKLIEEDKVLPHKVSKGSHVMNEKTSSLLTLHWILLTSNSSLVAAVLSGSG